MHIHVVSNAEKPKPNFPAHPSSQMSPISIRCPAAFLVCVSDQAKADLFALSLLSIQSRQLLNHLFASSISEPKSSLPRSSSHRHDHSGVFKLSFGPSRVSLLTTVEPKHSLLLSSFHAPSSQYTHTPLSVLSVSNCQTESLRKLVKIKGWQSGEG
ncbi:hypothetical protein M0R45_001128 [Rubus argutus]|uniref:Uncharacterized protein n=1 Tax=Rubus argutus TaxID=59490 RepID=A0AAW1VJK2_RUBAR